METQPWARFVAGLKAISEMSAEWMRSAGRGNFRGSMQTNFHFGKQNRRAAGALKAISDAAHN